MSTRDWHIRQDAFTGRIDQGPTASALADQILLRTGDILQALELDFIGSGGSASLSTAELASMIREAHGLLHEAAADLRLAAAPPSPAGRRGGDPDAVIASLLRAIEATLRESLGPGISDGWTVPVFAAVLRALERRPEEPDRRRRLEQLVAERAIASERRRIASEIHDKIGSDISRIRQCLELHDLYAASDPARAARKLAAARKASVAAMLTLNEVSSGISAALVPGIRQALESCSDYAAAVKGTALDVTVSGDEERIPAMLREQVILILGEAVRNAVAHSRAAHIRAWVRIGRASLRAEVWDDGAGFSLDRQALSPGTGLASMYERAATTESWFAIDTRPGAGTRVLLHAPLRQEAA